MDNKAVLSENQKFTASDPVKSEKNLSSLKKGLQTWLDQNSSEIATFHDSISAQWKANKDRNLATVESAIRGIGIDMERLGIALPKLGSDKVSDVSGSKFIKPR